MTVNIGRIGFIWMEFLGDAATVVNGRTKLENHIGNIATIMHPWNSFGRQQKWK